MLKIIKSPTRIQAAGNPPKTIEEFIGPVTSETTALSVARMVSPPGWSESGQTPEFDEFTVVLRGQLRVETRDGVQDVLAGQAVITPTRTLGALQHAQSRGCRVCRSMFTSIFTTDSSPRRTLKRPSHAMKRTDPLCYSSILNLN